MLDMIDGKYAARLRMPRSSVDELQHPLVSCSPSSTIAPRVMVSAFECECGTVFDAQLSLTVVYTCNTPRTHLSHLTRRRLALVSEIA